MTNKPSFVINPIRFLFVLSLLFTSHSLMAQDSTKVKEIVIQGKGMDYQGNAKTDLLIVNKRTLNGTMGNSDGTFSISVQKNDTIVFGAIGYSSVKVCFKDSVDQEVYELKIFLQKVHVNLGEAYIFAPRDLDEISKDIEKLGFQEKDYRTTGADALSSPITFLYEAFSKRERSKRLVMEMENDDRRRELLKELFAKYVAYEIIDLNTEQFDGFVDYLNVSDRFLQSSSQYEFCVYVKGRFYDYQKYLKREGLDDSDYNYHED